MVQLRVFSHASRSRISNPAVAGSIPAGPTRLCTGVARSCHSPCRDHDVEWFLSRLRGRAVRRASDDSNRVRALSFFAAYLASPRSLRFLGLARLRISRLRKKYFPGRSLTVAAKADSGNRPLIAAVNRCNSDAVTFQV